MAATDRPKVLMDAVVGIARLTAEAHWDDPPLLAQPPTSSAGNVKFGAVFGGRRPCRQGVPALPHVDQNHAPLLIFRAIR